MDKLNNIVYERAIPYEQYFGEMDLPKAEQKKRIESAEELENRLVEFFALITVLLMFSKQSVDDLAFQLRNEFVMWLSWQGGVDDQLMQYAETMSYDIVRATLDNIDNPWFTSVDRAAFISENEANSTANYKEWKTAIESGKKRKTWKTMRDRKVRKTHSEVDGKTIPIAEPFVVGDSLMQYPKDITAEPRETVGCRCVVKYL